MEEQWNGGGVSILPPFHSSSIRSLLPPPFSSSSSSMEGEGRGKEAEEEKDGGRGGGRGIEEEWNRGGVDRRRSGMEEE